MFERKLTALEEAAKKGDLEEVRKFEEKNQAMLEKIARINKFLEKDQISPETKGLSDHELISLWKMQEEQTSALILAAEGGHIEVVDELLKYDAVEKRQDFDRIWHMCMDPSDYREKLPSIHTALRKAIEKNHLEIVRKLLTKGATPDHQSVPDLSTPLIQAAHCGLINMVRELLSYKKVVETINEKDREGRTALMRAVTENWYEEGSDWDSFAVVKELLKRGAAIHEKDNSCQTALQLAEKAYKGKWGMKLGIDQTILILKNAAAAEKAFEAEAEKAFFDKYKSKAVSSPENAKPEFKPEETRQVTRGNGL